MVAYDHKVRENARSNPAQMGGVIANAQLIIESPSAAFASERGDIFLRFRAACLDLRCKSPTYEAVTISSDTTSASIAQASAAKKAETKLIRTAMLPIGTSDAR